MQSTYRAATVIAATAGGIALLANFHTTAGGTMLATTPALTPSTAVGLPPPGVVPTTTGGASTVGPSDGSTRTVDGPVITTRYGPVQVRVTMQGAKILDVQALELPSDRSKSQRISQQAGPLLRNEALQAQSASIHVVSGASFTSVGYARSLQAALSAAAG